MPSKEKHYSFLKNTHYYFKEIIDQNPKIALCLVAATACGVLLPFWYAKLPRLVLKGLEEHWSLSLFIEQILFFAVLLAITGTIRSAADSYIGSMSIPFLDIFNLHILKKRLSVDYDILENKQFHDEAYAAYDSLYRHHSEMQNGFHIWKEFFIAAISAALYGGILLTQSIGISILTLLPAFLTSFLQKKVRAYDKKMRLSAEASNRKMDYISRQTSNFRAGKDIRLFQLPGWFLGILRKERKISEGYVKQWENAYLAANCLDSILNFLRDSCAYLFLVVQILQGNMAVSDFVWYMAVVANCQQACATLLAQGEQLGRLNLDYGRIRRFLDDWNDTAFSGKQDTQNTMQDDPTSQHALEIEFRNVAFTYPESSHAALQDLNFTIRPGEKIALVGLNGAGKTTLVKLLCGLYHPTSGEILVNGRNIKDYGREAYYRMISAVFQNGKLLPLSIAQNVASAPKKDIDPDRVKECLMLSGLWEKVDKLPQKEYTSLGRMICENAIDLFGGERQKLWMARAFYKKALLLILDEPTAALDPLSEREIYEKYQDMSMGKTSLFISHRLSSTSFCDRIFFLEKGRITEKGSHQSLLKKGGAYAHLFEIQSQYYQKGGDTAWEA